jgi:hypothetical protein
VKQLAAIIGCVAFAIPAWGADDPAARALQQHQLQRQQQQDALQLRMQQQQHAVQSPPADSQQLQAMKQLEIDQQQRQQDLHYRQSIEPSATHPSDDEGSRRAKVQIEQERAQQQSQQQLRSFDAESQRQAERRVKEESRGEIKPVQAE